MVFWCNTMDIWSGLYSISLCHHGQGDWQRDTALWTIIAKIILGDTVLLIKNYVEYL